MITNHKKESIACVEACTTCLYVCKSCCGTEPTEKTDRVTSCKNAAQACQKYIDVAKLHLEKCTDKPCTKASIEAIKTCLETIELCKKTADSCENLGYDCETLCQETADACQETIDACNIMIQRACC